MFYTDNFVNYIVFKRTILIPEFINSNCTIKIIKFIQVVGTKISYRVVFYKLSNYDNLIMFNIFVHHNWFNLIYTIIILNIGNNLL